MQILLSICILVWIYSHVVDVIVKRKAFAEDKRSVLAELYRPSDVDFPKGAVTRGVMGEPEGIGQDGVVAFLCQSDTLHDVLYVT